MAAGKKQVLMAVYEILRQYSDAGHPLSIGQMGDMLAGVYGISAERKSISRNIRLLKELGYDLHLHGEAGQEGYYLQSRLFSDGQLRALIEALWSCPYITQRQAQELAGRLASLSTVHFSSRFRQVRRLEQGRRAGDGLLFDNLERIGEAIERRLKLRFCCQSYGLDGALHLTVDKTYQVSPFELTCAGGNYYLLAAEDGMDCVSRYRVDRMARVALLEDMALERSALPGGGMVASSCRRAVLQAGRSRVDDVVDAFGPGTPMRPIGSRRFEFTVDAPIQQIIGWVLRYAETVSVLEPPELKALLSQQAKLIYDRFAAEP